MISSATLELRGEPSHPLVGAVPPETKILVVEDDEEMRSMVLELLHEEGFEATGRADTVSGLVRLMAVGADVLVLDWKMPGLDGFDLLTTLRRCYPSVPVIFMTAYATDEIGERAMAAGAFSFLPKPFRGEALIAEIRKAVESSRGGSGGGPRVPPPFSRG